MIENSLHLEFCIKPCKLTCISKFIMRGSNELNFIQIGCKLAELAWSFPSQLYSHIYEVTLSELEIHQTCSSGQNQVKQSLSKSST
jgi:hypothetical protein